jgi:hypothetical protein
VEVVFMSSVVVNYCFFPLCVESEDRIVLRVGEGDLVDVENGVVEDGVIVPLDVEKPVLVTVNDKGVFVTLVFDSLGKRLVVGGCVKREPS